MDGFVVRVRVLVVVGMGGSRWRRRRGGDRHGLEVQDGEMVRWTLLRGGLVCFIYVGVIFL